MSKQYTATELKSAIMDTISLGMIHLQNLRTELTNINATEEDFANDNENARKARLLLTAANALNDTLHPLYDPAYQLFKDETSREIILGYQKLFKLLKSNSQCPCYTCSIKKGESNEHTKSSSGDSDTSQ